jgi:small subunit ribosomal protein S21
MNKHNKTQGLTVNVNDRPIDIALKKFKQKVENSGVLESFKNKMFYEKPTLVKKRKANAARARWLKKLKDQELPKKMY